MEKYSIEKCVCEDAVDLFDLQEGTYWTLNMFHEALKNDRVIFLKAVVDKKIVGHVALDAVLDEGEIHMVVINPDYRGKGIAKRLVKEAIKLANVKKIFLEVDETNEKAINLYKGLGFMPISKRKQYYGNVSAIIMQTEYKLN